MPLHLPVYSGWPRRRKQQILRFHDAAAAAKAAADGMMLGDALRDGDDNFTENLQSFEASQMQMGLQLRNYGIRAGNQSQFQPDP